jgi:hypothetical protein
MHVIETPQTRCQAALARCDITPPVGIYHRMWGAATHDRASGVHRPLLATLLWLAPESGKREQTLLIAALDHCILDQPDVEHFQQVVAEAARLKPPQVQVALSHTHAAGLMSRWRSSSPGGELIGPYLDSVADRVAQIAGEIDRTARPATIVYGRGRCGLAANRDLFDEARGHFVCGFNSTGPADDTVLIAKILADQGEIIGTVVNYACHPTTLAWQNTLISPDYVGALRATVEAHTRAPCLFLQGASADLGPREGFVGDPAIADRNGRQVGFAALAAFEELPAPGTRFAYAGPIVSGATIGTWRHEPIDAESMRQSQTWSVVQWCVLLAYRPDLPSAEQTRAELEQWRQREAEASAAGDAERARDCGARVEQATRQLWRLAALPQESFPLLVTLACLGGALWAFVAGEHYQTLQTLLRQRLPNMPIVVSTITNGWQPGYIPPADIYGRGIYQEQIAVVAAGSAEQLFAGIVERLRGLGVE